MDSKVFKKISKSDTGSKLIKAFRQVSSAAGNAPDATGLYGQVKEVTINGSLLISSKNDFDIDFDIPFDDDAEINESVISIYNLAPSTIAQIKKDLPIVVQAGYEKDSVGQILNGMIVSVRSYWDDLDHITEITAQDYNGTQDSELKDITFSKNTPASQILQDLSGRLGIPIAVFQITRDYVFENSVKINGSIMDGIRKYAKVCGVHAWINKSSLYVCPLDVPISEGYFDLKSDTGLLSVESWEESQKNEDYEDVVSGITAKMLLQHRIYTGSTIQITSRNVNGKFKVREGSHTADDDEFITTVKAIRM